VSPPLSIDKIDRLIATIDRRISSVVDEVLHHPSYQALEAAWRGLAFVVDHVAFEQNIGVSVCHCAEADLRSDLEEAAESSQSWLFRTVYSAEYGQFGGQPYGAIFLDFAITSSARDVAFLRQLASVAAMAHAPAFLAAQPALLGLTSFTELPFTSSLTDALDGPHAVAWNAFRDSEDSRYIGVLLPRMLQRAPYRDFDNGARTFVYNELTLEQEDLLWASPVFAFAVRMADSFAKSRSYMGMLGGTEDEPPIIEVHPTLGVLAPKPPIEVVLASRIEQQLSDLGLIVLACNPILSTLRFTRAPSLQRPRSFGSSEGGAAATLNFMLGTRLPYILLACRFAHYLKLIERERIGANLTRAELERELNDWLLQFVVALDSASASTRLRYPLRGARAQLHDVEGDPGWYRMEVRLLPHLKYMAQAFTISVVGKVEAR
jgi:type VI secretion system protein ImpC